MKRYHLTLCLLITAEAFRHYTRNLILSVVYDILFV